MTTLLNDEAWDELERMCQYIVELADGHIEDLDAHIQDEISRRSVWHSQRDILVAGEITSNAVKMYRLLRRLQAGYGDTVLSVDDQAAVRDLVVELTPDMEAIPEMDPGECENCQAQLTYVDVNEGTCRGCNTPLET